MFLRSLDAVLRLCVTLLLLGGQLYYWLGLRQISSFDQIRELSSTSPTDALLLAILGMSFLLLILSLPRKAPRVEPVSTLPAEVDQYRLAFEDSQAKLKAALEAREGQHSTRDSEDRAILYFVSQLQEKGRIVDFLMEDISSYPDSQVGQVARIVHQGCREVFGRYMKIVPVVESQEGEPLLVEANYDPTNYRLIGSVTGKPPYSGVLLHKGWKLSDIHFPEIHTEGSNTRVIVPAEVEVRPGA